MRKRKMTSREFEQLNRLAFAAKILQNCKSLTTDEKLTSDIEAAIEYLNPSILRS